MDPIALIKEAFHKDDFQTVQQLADQFPNLKQFINTPMGGSSNPIITMAKSPGMVDVLADLGADLNAKTNWWAGGFGVLHMAPREAAMQAIQRGAKVDIHAAARLGLFEELKSIVNANPAAVHQPGGDGQTALHFAATCEIADYLLDHGAAIDALDVDHESTPAQYMVKDRQPVAAHLIQRGCKTDILMASSLGMEELVKHHLAADENSIRIRVSEEFFPMVGGKSGGTIYQWVLGWHISPHRVALAFGHRQLFEFLMERSPADVQLANACWSGDKSKVENLLLNHSGLTENLTPADEKQLAHAARNNNLEAVRLMVQAGWPANGLSQHGATALHWAAWHGNVEMVNLLLNLKLNPELKDHDFKSTVLGWTLYASLNGWNSKNADYVKTAERLLQAGASKPGKLEGRSDVVEVVKAFPCYS